MNKYLINFFQSKFIIYLFLLVVFVCSLYNFYFSPFFHVIIRVYNLFSFTGLGSLNTFIVTETLSSASIIYLFIYLFFYLIIWQNALFPFLLECSYRREREREKKWQFCLMDHCHNLLYFHVYQNTLTEKMPSYLPLYFTCIVCGLCLSFISIVQNYVSFIKQLWWVLSLLLR